MKTLKKLCAFLALAASASAAFSSCDDNKGDEPDVVKDPLTLEISLDNLTATGVDMTVTPSYTDSTFYFDILGKEAYTQLQAEGLQMFFNYEVQARQDAYELSREEVLAKMLSTGVSDHSYTKLSPSTDYYAIAFGVSAEGKVSSSFVQKDFCTEAVHPSSNVLTISVSNIAENGADYSVKATVPDDTYLVDIWLKDLVDELGDGETMKYFIEYNSFYLPTLSASGDFDLPNEEVCQPGREYYVIAFGYADGEPTTQLFKKEFKTPGGDPAACSFKYEFSNLTASKVKIRVTPSDKKVVYIWNVLDMTTFNEYKKAQGTDEATLEYILNGGIEQTMEMDMVKRQQAVESLGRWSGYTTSDPEGYDEETISGLDGGEEYIVWAVAVDVNGKPLGKFYTDKFTTPQA